MALKGIEDPIQEIYDRFGIAQDAPVPEDLSERQSVQIKVRAKIYDAANEMNDKIRDSRELSLALTHLEEALMWAGKAIFK